MINDIKLEKGVVSSLINDNGLLLEFFQDVNPNLFYNSNCRYIIEIVIGLQNEGVVSDFDSVERKLLKLKSNIDIFDYSTPLNSHNFINYINILKELTYKRELKKLSVMLLPKSDDKLSDVFNINNELNQSLTKLTNIITTNKIENNIELIKKVINEIEFAKKNKGVTGCLTGFTEIDAMTGGWQNGDLIILAARPAMGKTSLAINQALNAAIDYDKNILFFSLEMSSVQLMKRQFSLMTDIPLQDLSNDSKLDVSDLANKVVRLEDSFKLFDKCFNLYDIKAQCRKENNAKKVDAIYIDYLQLIKHSVDKGRSKENEVSEISRELKLLAKELNTPIICLSQLSRAVESRGGAKIPMLSDLRDSGSIEQDADIVNFIYRPEYYGITEDENGESTSGIAMIVFAKNRNGKTGNIKLRFMAELTKFITLNEFKIEQNDDWLND